MESVFRNCDVLVERVIQSDDTRCGAASCVMFFRHHSMAIDEDLAARSIEQHEVEPDDWWADPQGVARCLDSPWDPDLIDGAVDIASFSSAESLCSWIAHCITTEQKPVIVLVYAGAHWILVDGVRWEDTDGESKLVGVQVVDPYSHEPARRFVPVATFVRRYAEPNEFGKRWFGQHLGIGIEKPGGVLPVVPLAYKAPKFLHQMYNALLRPYAFYTPYLSAISQLNSLGYIGLSKPRGGGGPANVLRVQGIDAPDVLMVRIEKNGTGQLWAALDAKTGTVLEVTEDVPALVALDAATVSSFTAPDHRTLSIEDGLYWAPGTLSSSRLTALRRVHVDNVPYFLFPGGRLESQIPQSVKGGG